ncbi:MAG: M48 family metalloprotease [Candidatus Omnitrophica bacterium]|nr:M48 family metalloprotease [Candidatus Omnitrophota bacterium]
MRKETRGGRLALPLLAACLLAGCATSYNVATERQESLFITTEREVQMGKAVSKRVEEELPVVRDPALLERLDRVGQRIAAVADRKDIVYQFAIVEEKEPNAFALPGGIVYVTSGLMELVKSDDELASVLGHEVGHLTARHVVKRIQGALGLELLQILAVGAGSTDSRTRQGMDLAFASLLTAYSQNDELEADRLGARYMKRAGFQPGAAITFLTRLRDHTLKEPLREFSYFRTHPYFSDRLRVVRQESEGKISFDDYINTQR